jgi:hypothetical protein
MNKLLWIPLAGIVFFTGCATTAQQQNVKPISFKSISLLDKYGVNENALMKAGKNAYIFIIPDPNGTAIYKIDKNYNLIWKKVTPILLDAVKSEVKDGKLYILGNDQNKNRVAFLEYDLNGKLDKITYYGKKYDLARDFIMINGKTYVAVTQYSPNSSSDIVIYSQNNKDITLSTPNMDDVTFIKPYKKGILIIGTTQNTSQDVIIAYKTLDNKTVWAESIDLGMDEKPESIEIKNNEIILKILSTDHMGAEKEVTFIIDENGKVKSVKKGIEFKQLPVKYRT